MKKVCIINGGSQYAFLFRDIGFEPCDQLNEADLICFTGGSDVSPSLYGHKEHMQTFTNTFRDEAEMVLFKEGLKLGKPFVGICRGGQFLNVMSGGEMYQDVTKHGFSHDLTDLETGEVVYVSSTHHQMMKPSDRAIIVAVANQGGTREWWDGEVFKREVSKDDVEVVFYEHTRSLCFQPHPEFTGKDMVNMRMYFLSLINRFLKV